MQRTKRLIIALGIAGLLTTGTVVAVGGGGGPPWAIPCVDLNDLIEQHWVDRPENVGIYQAVHGENAEAACRSDHRGEVQSLFNWAFLPFDVLSYDPEPPVQKTVDNTLRHTDKDANGRVYARLHSGRWIVAIHWHDKNEWFQTFAATLSGRADGLINHSVTLVNSPAQAGTAYLELEIFYFDTEMWIEVDDDSRTKWTVEFIRS